MTFEFAAQGSRHLYLPWGHQTLQTSTKWHQTRRYFYSEWATLEITLKYVPYFMDRGVELVCQHITPSHSAVSETECGPSRGSVGLPSQWPYWWHNDGVTSPLPEPFSRQWLEQRAGYVSLLTIKHSSRFYFMRTPFKRSLPAVCNPFTHCLGPT